MLETIAFLTVETRSRMYLCSLAAWRNKQFQVKKGFTFTVYCRMSFFQNSLEISFISSFWPWIFFNKLYKKFLKELLFLHVQNMEKIHMHQKQEINIMFLCHPKISILVCQLHLKFFNFSFLNGSNSKWFKKLFPEKCCFHLTPVYHVSQLLTLFMNFFKFLYILLVFLMQIQVQT